MKSALVILFNQDFSQNIPKLDSIYKGRFSKIVYLVPSHYSQLHKLYLHSNLPQVIPWQLDKLCYAVRRFLGKENPYELRGPEKQFFEDSIYKVIGHQFYFYHFLVQASDYLFNLDVDWYWITGDDAVLHPDLNEKTLPHALKMNTLTDSVLCQPVIGSDRWIEEIAVSVKEAEKRMRKSFGNEFPLKSLLNIKLAPGTNTNTLIPVACADFFGIKKNILDSVVTLWKNCFKEKIYVEMAMPSVLLSTSQNPLLFSNFIWERDIRPEGWQVLYEKLKKSNVIFAHPIKLSSASVDEVQMLRT